MKMRELERLTCVHPETIRVSLREGRLAARVGVRRGALHRLTGRELVKCCEAPLLEIAPGLFNDDPALPQFDMPALLRHRQAMAPPLAQEDTRHAPGA